MSCIVLLTNRWQFRLFHQTNTIIERKDCGDFWDNPQPRRATQSPNSAEIITHFCFKLVNFFINFKKKFSQIMLKFCVDLGFSHI